jgi:fibronectin type 3 domain-containing protein
VIGEFPATIILATILLSCASVAAPVAASAQSVELTWVQSQSPSVVSNVVYRAPIWRGPYVAIFGSSEPITEFTDAGVVPNEIYCYYVTAVDARGVESSRSNKVCRTIHENTARIVVSEPVNEPTDEDGDEQ